MTDWMTKDWTQGENNALVKKLGGNIVARKILKDAVRFVLVTSDDVRTDDLAAFFRNRPGLWVSSDFQSQVLAKVANTSTEARYVDLECGMSDAEIEKMLGPGHIFGDEQVCKTIARLIGAQPNGEEGELLKNGFNLFYVGSCVVGVVLRARGRSWDVETWRRSGGGWRTGCRAFSPATLNPSGTLVTA